MRILAILFLTLLCARAEERILNFDSEIRIGRDGYLDVVETIRVNVEGNRIQRGIYRDFPQEYETKWGLKQIRPFKVTGVERNGVEEPYSVERLGSGTRVRIGSADVMLEIGSVQEYRISYRTGGQLLFDEKGDELYWNVTGNFWDFPIMQARARVVLPEGLEVQEAEAYTGATGEKGRAYEKSAEPDGVSFRTTEALRSLKGLTVVVRWAPGKLDAAAYRKPSIWTGNLPLLAALVLVAIGVLAYAVCWNIVGRDPARGVIVPGWEPPEGFSPAAVRYLKNMGFDDRCFTAGVLSLASKGFLTIEEYGKGTYKLISKVGDGLMTPDEVGLFQKLFSVGDSLELTQKNHVRIGGAKTHLTQALAERVHGTYFHNHTGKWFIGFLFCAGGLAITTLLSSEPMVVLFVTVFLGAFALAAKQAAVKIFSSGGSKIAGTVVLLVLLALCCIGLVVVAYFAGVWSAIATLVVIVSSSVFHFLMKAPTKAGRKVLDVIAGFQEYLSVAEEDRLNLENPPERTPELFERFLPYALALGVEQKWSEKFDDVLSSAGSAQDGHHYQPSFYTGSSYGMERALTGAALGAAIGGALASSSVAPSSSGSGGGGSSGGGGGGGGGGGW